MTSLLAVVPSMAIVWKGLQAVPPFARWGCNLNELPPTHEGREIVAGYLGQMAASIALVVSAERVIFGGGVMSDGTLLPLIRAAAARCLNGYLPMLSDDAQIESYIRSPGLGAQAGIVGALLLAQDALPPR